MLCAYWVFKIVSFQGIARTQSPTNKNYVVDLPAFGVIAGVSLAQVQWPSLALEDRRSGSPIPPYKVSMNSHVNDILFYT